MDPQTPNPEQGSQLPVRGHIPRLSKLPMPRAMASSDNLKLSAHSIPSLQHDDLRKASHIPRPMGPTSPLGENINQSIRSRYGWTDPKPGRPRNQSPVRDALRDIHASTLDTTPPSAGSDRPVFEVGDENPTTAKAGLKNRQLPQDTSPPSSPTTTRPDSPSKRPFRPPGRMSPTKDTTTVPPVVSPGEIYTPPKALVKGQRSRMGKPSRETTRAASSVFATQQDHRETVSSSKHSAQTVKLRPTHGTKTATSTTLKSRPSLSSIFREPAASNKPPSKLGASGVESHSALLKPRSRGENTIAPSTPPKANSKAKRQTAPQPDPAVVALKEKPATTSPKSSASLRDTIAKAKAAKRKARESAVSSTTTESAWPSNDIDEQFVVGGDNKGLLRKRIQQAVTSGHLNIAALNLKEIPTEVMKMYDPENSKTNWAEMVDLIKLTAADNELEELEPTMFPKRKTSHLDDDDDVNRQFFGLEVIDLHRNHLQRLPLGVAMLDRLHTLNLNGNKLKNDVLEIVSQIPHLRELQLADNLLEGNLDFSQFSSGEASGFEHLEILDLHGNALSSFVEDGLRQLQDLKVLNIGGNKFSSIDWLVNSASTLTDLDISKNQLSGALFSNDSVFGELRNLDASFNDLERVFDKDDCSGLPNLRSLIVTGNRIIKLHALEHSKQLLTLSVSDNQLEEIPADFMELESLKRADFANNNIRLVPSEIATMSNLTNLNLVGNPLRVKKYLSMETSEIKQDLEKKLDAAQPDANATAPEDPVSGTQYRYSPSNGVLDLSSQCLSSIPMDDIDLTSQVQAIHTVKLSNNELTSFPADLLSHPSIKYSIQSLDMSHNPQLHPTNYLSDEVFLPNLKSIYIVSTGLTSLDALTTHLRAPELREVNISCHRLAGHVPWIRAWWPNATTLLATDNWFTSVDVEGVRGLEVLDIRNNEIDVLPAKLGLLGNLPDQKERAPGRLRVLEVSGNRFRVPRLNVVEKGTEAVLRDLRRMVKEEEVTEEWMGII